MKQQFAMRYNNEYVRRQNRLLSEESAQQLLRNTAYGVLSMRSENAGVYGIPISYAWDGTDAIYVHCAKEGRKLASIEACNKVSFCVVGETKVLPAQFSTLYESVVLECKAYKVLEKEEKMKALELILLKYSPDDMEEGRAYATRAVDKTMILRLDIIQWSGKCRETK